MGFKKSSNKSSKLAQFFFKENMKPHTTHLLTAEPLKKESKEDSRNQNYSNFGSIVAAQESLYDDQ